MDAYNIDHNHTLWMKHPFEDADDLVEKITGHMLYEELDLMFRHFVIPQHLQLLEQTSLGQMMRGVPIRKWGVRHLSDEAYEFIGRSTSMLWFERASLLQFVLNELALKEPAKYELENGMETIIHAFDQHIKKVAKRKGQALILRDAQVTTLRNLGNEVEVTWHSHVAQTGRYDYVICTVPAPATARIIFDPPLTATKYEALTNLSYASAAKTIVRCTKRFWELNDGIYGGGSYTDLPNQQCWYPSDNSQPDRDARPNVGPIRENEQPIDWRCKDPERSKQPGVFTAAYMWEGNARRFAALDRPQRTEFVLSSVEKLHRGFRTFVRDENKDVEHCSWDTESSPGGGAFAFFAPGEQHRYQAALCEPHFQDAGGRHRLFFAGEHVAIAHAWIQSAVQSALTAVMHVLRTP